MSQDAERKKIDSPAFDYPPDGDQNPASRCATQHGLAMLLADFRLSSGWRGSPARVGSVSASCHGGMRIGAPLPPLNLREGR